MYFWSAYVHSAGTSVTGAAGIGCDTSRAGAAEAARWPVDGRQVGLVVGPDVDAGSVEALRSALDAAGVVPLVIGPHGGVISGVTVQRSYAVAASVELDAVVIVSAAPPAADAQPTVDTKAGASTGATDPRIVKLLSEAWRHAKVIGLVTGAEDVLAAAGIPDGGPGVVAGDPDDVVAGLLELMAEHRIWDRFAPVSPA